MPDPKSRTSTRQLHAHLTRAGHRRLDHVRAQGAQLYNAALQERRDAWRDLRRTGPPRQENHTTLNRHPGREVKTAST